MGQVFFVCMIAAMLGVLGTLIAGMVVMARGGEVNRRFSNPLMRWRVILQGVALMFFVLAMVAGK